MSFGASQICELCQWGLILSSEATLFLLVKLCYKNHSPKYTQNMMKI